MPGLSLLYGDRLSTKTREAAYRDLVIRDGYTVQEFYSDKHLSLAFSGYDSYPVKRFENRHSLIALEGMIYNKSDHEIESSLQNIAVRMLDNLNIKTQTADFIDSSDGDFLAVILLKKNGRILVFNDRWGRLPTFYFYDSSRFCLSRELKFILHFIPSITFNRAALCELLTLEYNLGDKTIFKNIKRLKPGSMLEVKPSGDGITFNTASLLPVDFTCQHDAKNREDYIEESLKLFKKSIADRIKTAGEKGFSLITDLSGGFDTRAVFASLGQTGVDFTAVHDKLFSADESDIASQVAEKFGKTLICFSAKHPGDNIEEMRHVTYITDAMVNCRVATSCYRDDLEHEKSIKGRIARLTGLGGEFLRQIYQPKKFYRNITSMIMDNAFTHFVDIADACSMLKMPPRSFNSSLEKEIRSFPENDIRARLRHLYFESYSKVDIGGENRHRIFNWTISPFWGKNLFSYVNQVIPPEMITYGFYIEFLKRLDKRALEVPVYGISESLNTASGLKKFLWKRRLKETIRDNRFTYKLAKRFASGRAETDKDHELEKYLAETIIDIGLKSKAVAHCFNIPAVQRYPGSNPGLLSIYQLLTFILYIEEVENRFGDRIDYTD